MNIRELIENLEKFDKNLIVYIEDGEFGDLPVYSIECTIPETIFPKKKYDKGIVIKSE